MKLTISHCKSQDLDRFDKNPQKVSWSEELSSALKKLHKPIKFDKNKIRIALFRPFIKQFLYFDPVFITAKYKIPLFYSSNSTDNPSIIVPDKTKSEFSTMISETSPDLQVIANGQCFPLYAKIHKGSKLDLGLQSSNPPILQSSNPPILQYRDSGARQNQGRVLGIHHRHNTGSAHIGNQSGVSIQGNVGGGGGAREEFGNYYTGQNQGRVLGIHNQSDTGSRSSASRTGFPNEGEGMKDNITDWALEQYRTQYKDNSITKQDVFYYTYGMLHHTEYRNKYQASLVRGLPHIPMAPDFWAFSKAGRKLADLHLNYDTCPRYNLGKPKNTIPDKPTSIRLGRKENTTGMGSQTVVDPSKLLIDNVIVYDKLPPCKYKVNGRTPVEWLTYVPKKAANGTDRFPFRFMKGVELRETIERLVHVGIESDKIISSLPEEFEVIDSPSFDESLPAMGQQTLDHGTQTRLK